MSAKLLEFPKQGVSDVPTALRNLADDIERGEYGASPLLAWAIDSSGIVQCGLCGPSSSPGAEAHLLFSVAMRKLECV